MIDMKTLLPEVSKLLPGIPAQELMAGIQQYAKENPNLNNQEAIQALMAYLQQKQSAAPRFQNLVNSLPTGVK